MFRDLSRFITTTGNGVTQVTECNEVTVVGDTSGPFQGGLHQVVINLDKSRDVSRKSYIKYYPAILWMDGRT